METFKMEEVYEKCRALVSVLTDPLMDTDDRITLTAILDEEFTELGNIIGIVRKK